MHRLLALDLRNEVLQHGGHIADDRHVRLTVLADFRRVDVDMDHACARSERVELAGDAVVETCADRDQQIATLHGAGRRDCAVHAEHAKHLRIGIGHNAARRKGGDDRSAGHFRQLLDQLARVGFDILGLQTFLTAGVKEVRAWQIHKGWTAPQAAGVIHTDFERGFIKADIVSYDDFVAAEGSMVKIKEEGKLRQEGRDYVMQDGDIVEFKFNVSKGK